MLDIALGTGGFPPGSIIEISGKSGSGKTTLCQTAVAQAQSLGGLCAWLDTDLSFSPAFAALCGVQIPDLYYSQPTEPERALEIMEVLAWSGAFSVLVLDSLHFLTSISGYPDDPTIVRIHEIFANFLQRVSALISRNQTVLIFTSLPSEQMSEVYHELGSHLNRLALKFHATHRMMLKPVSQYRRDGRSTGVQIEARITKNKFVPCLYTTNFDIMFNKGINKPAEVFVLAVSAQMVRQEPEGYCYGETILGKTALQAATFLSQNQALCDKLEQMIRRKLIPPWKNAA